MAQKPWLATVRLNFMRTLGPLSSLAVLSACAMAAPLAPPEPPAEPAVRPPWDEVHPWPEGLRLTVEPRRARAGDLVTLVLRNDTPAHVGYNLCLNVLERRVGTVWQPLRPQMVCTLELRVLPTAQEARFQHRLARDQPSGEYRFWTRVESPLGSHPQKRFVSDTFIVER